MKVVILYEGNPTEFISYFPSCILFVMNFQKWRMDKYNNAACSLLRGTEHRWPSAALCCAMAEKERKAGGLAWHGWQRRLEWAWAVVDAMEPDDLLTLATATQQGGRRELEDGSWARERTARRLCSKMAWDAWMRLTTTAPHGRRAPTPELG
jgi:hypothetical protein